MRRSFIVMAVCAVILFINCSDNGVSSNSGGGGGGGGGSYTYTGRTVQIGNLTWMAENLNRNTNNSWCYDNNSSNCAKYGRLYTWDAARGACPSGWRLPTGADWNNLMTAVGGSSTAGTKLKSQTGWYNDGNGTDEFGFSALPGGFRITGGSFNDVGNNGCWWSASEVDAAIAPHWYMYWDDGEFVYSPWGNKSNGLSVRCVR